MNRFFALDQVTEFVDRCGQSFTFGVASCCCRLLVLLSLPAQKPVNSSAMRSGGKLRFDPLTEQRQAFSIGLVKFNEDAELVIKIWLLHEPAVEINSGAKANLHTSRTGPLDDLGFPIIE